MSGSAGRFRKALGRLTPLLRRWRDDRRGAIAIQFAFMVVPLAVLSFGLIDLNRVNTQKYNLQDSLDAAALYAARSNATTSEQIQIEGEKALKANLQLAEGAKLVRSSFILDGVAVIADAEASMPTVVSDLWTNKDLTVKVHTEVMRNSNNVEVALVLDTTGSMAGQKIEDLKLAAAELIDIVVKPPTQQTPFYSKVAIVPYSMAVNVGDVAAQARGAIKPAKSISGASWTTGAAKSIGKITTASTAVVTANNHGFSNGDYVYIEGVSNMSELNGKAYLVKNKTSNSFDLYSADNKRVDTSKYKNNGSDGTVAKCAYSNCDAVIQASGHGFASNDRVRITDIKRPTAFNNRTFQITRVNGDNFLLKGSGPGEASYTSGGSAWCTVAGCEYFWFQNAANGAERTHKISTCVSERTTHAYTDAAPSSTPLGYNYPATANPCLTNKVSPLSSNIASLKNQVTGLTASGSTGGHVGVAWGWYMVSPNFGYLWSDTASRPAAYTADHTMKVVVLMTDGEYNSAYCKGVISADSTNGSGSADDHINCNAPNGHSFTQSTALCTAMKAAGVIVYTVGFNIVDDQRARDLVNNCATDAKHVYIANGGTALKDAFVSIGHEIDNLRLSR